MELNERETAIVLVALRFFQANIDELNDEYDWITDFPDHCFGQEGYLSSEEVELLCEKINGVNND